MVENDLMEDSLYRIVIFMEKDDMLLMSFLLSTILIPAITESVPSRE